MVKPERKKYTFQPLLDEPTNHLDIDLREILEEALLYFEESILFVSHDRYFIECLANRVWVTHIKLKILFN